MWLLSARIPGPQPQPRVQLSGDVISTAGSLKQDKETCGAKTAITDLKSSWDEKKLKGYSGNSASRLSYMRSVDDDGDFLLAIPDSGLQGISKAVAGNQSPPSWEMRRVDKSTLRHAHRKLSSDTEKSSSR